MNVVDVEDLAKRGEPVPTATQYRIRVDKTQVVVNTPTPTGALILSLVGMSPATRKLYLIKRGNQPVQVGPDEVVDLRQPGIERFSTMPKDTTEGGGGKCRRQFRLPEHDEQFLGHLGREWETVIENGCHWLILVGWEVPRGYNCTTVKIALLIPPSYPDTQIDMVYFLPGLARQDQRHIGALSGQVICSETWQRWSRHRTSANPWRPGIDDIASHLSLVDEWLRREIERAA